MTPRAVTRERGGQRALGRLFEGRSLVGCVGIGPPAAEGSERGTESGAVLQGRALGAENRQSAVLHLGAAFPC